MGRAIPDLGQEGSPTRLYVRNFQKIVPESEENMSVSIGECRGSNERVRIAMAYNDKSSPASTNMWTIIDKIHLSAEHVTASGARQMYFPNGLDKADDYNNNQLVTIEGT